MPIDELATAPRIAVIHGRPPHSYGDASPGAFIGEA